MTRPPLHSIQQIVAMLTARIDQLARDLLPHGRRQGREWVCGGLDGREGRGLSVCLSGAKQGVWAEFSAGLAGDPLDLIAQAKCGGDKGEALKWARGWLGLSNEGARTAAPPPPPPPRVDHAAEAQKRRQRGARLFGEALPWPGTPVESYLAGRAIPRAALAHVPKALRYHAELFCYERQKPAPAMLACIMRGSRMIGLHQTWIDRGADGVWRKAAIDHAKKSLGSMSGGYIPLARGASGKPLSQAPAGDTVALCEGIEDGLTIALECPEWRVLATINSGNLGAIDLPETVAEVVLCCDRDGENPAVARAVEQAMIRYGREGRTVRLVRPPEGFKDFNDWRRAMAPARRSEAV